jgi:hypothetical protein
MLGEHAGLGDLLIDLTWSIEFFAIAEWARDHGVLYTNSRGFRHRRSSA